MATDENESPTAAWRAAVREREAADLERIRQQQEDYRAGKRWPIHGANWDAESLGLVPPSPRLPPEPENPYRYMARNGVAPAYIKARAADMEADILAGRVVTLEPWETFLRQVGVTDAASRADDDLGFEVRMARHKVEYALQVAGAERLIRKLAGPIPLTGSTAGIVFGTLVEGGADLVIPLRKMQHQLVVGTTGYGKSVYLHGLIQQLLASAEVGRVVLIDLKEGGVTFARYRNDPKAMTVWRFDEIQLTVDRVLDVMRRRGEQMSAQGIEAWRGQRIAVIIDEFADIQAEVAMAETKEEKAAGRKLIHNLTRISQRARSFGILLVCAMQRPSADSIDASLRANLPCRICFRVNTSAMAASVLDGLDDAPVRPQHLPKGRFIYYDGGEQQLVQAHVAPGIDLGD